MSIVGCWCLCAQTRYRTELPLKCTHSVTYSTKKGVKLSICLLKYHFMKARRVEVSFRPALITTGDGRERLDCRTGRFTPCATATDNH
jgi:hypothetical protein